MYPGSDKTSILTPVNYLVLSNQHRSQVIPNSQFVILSLARLLQPYSDRHGAKVNPHPQQPQSSVQPPGEDISHLFYSTTPSRLTHRLYSEWPPSTYSQFLVCSPEAQPFLAILVSSHQKPLLILPLYIPTWHCYFPLAVNTTPDYPLRP